MIDELYLNDIALIHQAYLEPHQGLTVITGETGSGKTALLTGFKLLIGARSDTTLVREGADELSVSARLFGAYDTEDGLVVQRRLTKEGRSRISCNNTASTLHELEERLAPRVDLCAQHEHQRMLDPHFHAMLLDQWIGEAAREAADRYQKAFQAYTTSVAEYTRLKQQSEAGAYELEESYRIRDEIEAVDPQEGEDILLKQQLDRMGHAEKLFALTQEAKELLGGEEGILDKLNALQLTLGTLIRLDETQGDLSQPVDESLYSLEDTNRLLERYAHACEFDPADIEQTSERYHAINGLKKRFGPGLAEVRARLDQARELIALHEHSAYSEDALMRAELACTEAKTALIQAGDAYTQLRVSHAPQLSTALDELLVDLAMGSAHIEVLVTPFDFDRYDQTQASSVELMYAPGKNLQPRPLKRIASGGEMSRVLLAAKVVLGDTDHIETLIFDEIDAGLGGSTATAVARMLKRLAQNHQVIAVTHLAQVASVADKHYVVEKDAGEVPTTQVFEVTGDRRVDEVARMLSGRLDEPTRVLAAQMLAESGFGKD